MKRARWIIVGALLLFLVGRSLWTPHPVVFHDLQEASVSIQAAGFQCTSDRSDGSIHSGFLVSRDEVNWSDVNALCKIGKLGPEWEGKVWITFHGPEWNFFTYPDTGGARVWGSVSAFGDQKFLDKLEGLLQRPGTGVM